MSANPASPAQPLLDLAFPFIYAEAVQWTAPRRGIATTSREALLARLAREAAAMDSAQITPMRRTAGDQQAIDEYSVRFVYRGTGIENIPFVAGERIELERLRILTLKDGEVTAETCIETWTKL